MPNQSSVDPLTFQAYLETEYRVQGIPAFILKVGEANDDLLRAHRRHGADCSAFLTACNPFSEPFDEASNAARQAALAAELSRRGLIFLPGVGQHPSNEWPGESSYLAHLIQTHSRDSLATMA